MITNEQLYSFVEGCFGKEECEKLSVRERIENNSELGCYASIVQCILCGKSVDFSLTKPIRDKVNFLNLLLNSPLCFRCNDINERIVNLIEQLEDDCVIEESYHNIKMMRLTLLLDLMYEKTDVEGFKRTLNEVNDMINDKLNYFNPLHHNTIISISSKYINSKDSKSEKVLMKKACMEFIASVAEKFMRLYPKEVLAMIEEIQKEGMEDKLNDFYDFVVNELSSTESPLGGGYDIIWFKRVCTTEKIGEHRERVKALLVDELEKGGGGPYGDLLCKHVNKSYLAEVFEILQLGMGPYEKIVKYESFPEEMRNVLYNIAVKQRAEGEVPIKTILNEVRRAYEQGDEEKLKSAIERSLEDLGQIDVNRNQISSIVSKCSYTGCRIEGPSKVVYMLCGHTLCLEHYKETSGRCCKCNTPQS